MRFLILGLLTAAVFSCCEEEPANVFAGCCGAESTTFTAPGLQFYIPNAITPNLDGINDLFYVLSDYPNTSILDQFVVTDRNGEVLYSKASIPPGDVTHGWDGVTPAGSTYEGLFHFEIQVRDTLDILHTITGSACALPCGQKVIDPFMDSWLNCKFGLQHDGQGGFDEFLPSGETSCE